jgi:hypothetical protein
MTQKMLRMSITRLAAGGAISDDVEKVFVENRMEFTGRTRLNLKAH